MIYITQLIFIKQGKESMFQEFESHAIPLMEKYGGKMLYRIRPQKEDIQSEAKEIPYEIHFISFESETHLEQFINDDNRLKYVHLKNTSVTSTLLVKGEKI